MRAKSRPTVPERRGDSRCLRQCVGESARAFPMRYRPECGWRRVEAAFPNDEAVTKRRSKDHMKANVAVESV
jgi:hypothetical protein